MFLSQSFSLILVKLILLETRKKAACRPLFPRPCGQLVGHCPTYTYFFAEAWLLFPSVIKVFPSVTKVFPSVTKVFPSVTKVSEFGITKQKV